MARHPALRAARAGARSQPRAHPAVAGYCGGDLAAEGLIAERVNEGPLHLVRLRPEPEALTWPGQPDAVAEGAPQGAGGHRFLPRAASPCCPVPEAAGWTSASGQLRAVAADRPVARLCLHGPAEAVFRLARALAEDLPLLPPVAGLAELGRALARPEAPRPRRSGPAVLGGAADVGEAVAAAIGHLALALLHQRDGALEGTRPEPVHQMRVALRRLRAILRLFRPATGAPLLLRLEAELKTLAGRLGPARDWDVFLAGIGAEVAAAVGEDARLAALLRAARAAREAAYATLREALSEPEFRLLALDLAEAAAHPAAWRPAAPAPETELAGFAAALLERRWRKLRKRGKEMARLDLAAFHALRIEAKRLRYAAELFAPLWPGKGTRRFLKHLARLQDAMGLANDAEVARGLVAALPGAGAGRAWAGGVVEGWCLARAVAARRQSEECWQQLKESKPFWRDPPEREG